MAKLSAHGYEVARLSINRNVDNHDGDGPDWQRYTYHYSFRSDGQIMQRIVGHDVHPDRAEGDGRRHDWGWKLWKKLQDPKRDTVARQKALAASMAAAAADRGRTYTTTLDES